jgi:hypothetical protein
MVDHSIELFTVAYDMYGRGYPSLSDHGTNVSLSPVIGIPSLRRIGLVKLPAYGPPPSKQALVATTVLGEDTVVRVT